MSSPIESPSPVSNPPSEPKKTDSHFEAWGIKLPLPRWAIVIVGMVAVLGSLISVGSRFWPNLSGGKVQPAFINPAKPMLTEVQPSNQGNKVSDAEMIDYRESIKHTDETPKTDRIILNSPDLGTLKVKFFISDRCLLVIRRGAGANPATTSHYILAAKMEDRSPGQIDNLGASLLRDSAVDQDLMAAQMEPAAFKPGAESGPVAPAGNCLNPHPGEFRWWNGQQNGCWIQVFRAWPDGCQHYQWFNSCNGYWDSLPNGAPQVYWTNCNH
jgi:hypothetical protein